MVIAMLLFELLYSLSDNELLVRSFQSLLICCYFDAIAFHVMLFDALQKAQDQM